MCVVVTYKYVQKHMEHTQTFNAILTNSITGTRGGKVLVSNGFVALEDSNYAQLSSKEMDKKPLSLPLLLESVKH